MEEDFPVAHSQRIAGSLSHRTQCSSGGCHSQSGSQIPTASCDFAAAKHQLSHGIRFAGEMAARVSGAQHTA